MVLLQPANILKLRVAVSAVTDAPRLARLASDVLIFLEQLLRNVNTDRRAVQLC